VSPNVRLSHDGFPLLTALTRSWPVETFRLFPEFRVGGPNDIRRTSAASRNGYGISQGDVLFREFVLRDSLVRSLVRLDLILNIGENVGGNYFTRRIVVTNPSRRAAARRRLSSETNSRVDGRASATKKAAASWRASAVRRS
jgi:hypothetical protein